MNSFGKDDAFELRVIANGDAQGVMDLKLERVMKPIVFIYMILVPLLFAQNICVAGTIHKCTDSNGNVYFTDTQSPTASTVTKETIQIQSAPPPRNPRSDYTSLQDQLRTLDKSDARRAREKAQRQHKWEASRRSSEQRKNRREAEKLTKKAQKKYKKAASNEKMLKSQRRALQEQGQSLQRQADVLMGRRETTAPNRSEVMDRKLRGIEDEIDSLRTQQNINRANW